MDHIIDRLGGVTAVANALNAKPNAVANWKHEKRNIPWRYRPIIARIAAERGITLPEDFWGEAA